jgi:hypothetical protein
MPDVMHLPGKVVDPRPATFATYFNKFWGVVKRESPPPHLWGPDMWGAKYALVRAEYEPVLDRTALHMQPVIEDKEK